MAQWGMSDQSIPRAALRETNMIETMIAAIVVSRSAPHVQDPVARVGWFIMPSVRHMTHSLAGDSTHSSVEQQ